jgi:Matrixin
MFHFWYRRWILRENDLSAGRTSKRRSRSRHSKRPFLERLEDRALPSTVDFSGVPLWVSQGPAPEIGNPGTVGLTSTSGANPAAGAVQAIAQDPNNPSVIYIGPVNGGVWKATLEANGDPDPHWTPLTDQFPSLSIGSLAVSPLDSNVVFAGVGVTSSGGYQSGPRGGLLRSQNATQDGAIAWTQIPPSAFFSDQMTMNNFGAFNIMHILPTQIGGDVAHEVVLVSALSENGQGGLFLSNDGGLHWTMVSGQGQLPSGYVSSLVVDQSNIIYAAVVGQGIFDSTDGSSWTPLATTASSNGIPSNILSNSTLGNIHLAVDANGTLYAAIAGPGFFGNGDLMGVWRSPGPNGPWTQLGGDPPHAPGDVNVNEVQFGQGVQEGNLLVDLVALDPSNPQTLTPVLYMAGSSAFPVRWPAPLDSQPPSTLNNLPVVFRGVVTSDPTSGYQVAWTPLVSNASSPHADGRDLEFDDQKNLLFSSDGGIYRLPNPSQTSSTWQSMIGDLRAFELYDVAYDPVQHVIIGGAQDDGVPYQNSQNSAVWTAFQGGDGGQVGIGGVPADRAFYTTNDFGLVRFTPETNADGTIQSNPMAIQLIDKRTITPDNPGGTPFAEPQVKAQPFAFSTLEDRMVIQTINGPKDPPGGLYESDVYDPSSNTINLNYLGQFPISLLAFTAPIVYGGQNSDGTPAPEVLWFGASNQVFLRTSRGTMPSVTSYSGDVVRALGVDSSDFHRAAVLDASGHVWYTPDAGNTFYDITGNLANLPNDGTNDLSTLSLDTVAIIDDGNNVAIFVGGQGGVYWIENPDLTHPALQSWTEFGRGLPNAYVTDVHYDPTDDILVAATFGRGAWTVPSASTFVTGADIDLGILGDAGAANHIVLRRNPNNPLLLDAFVDGQPVLGDSPLPVAALQTILVNGGGGHDTITVDFSNGVFALPDHINVSGGADVTVEVIGGPSSRSETLDRGAGPASVPEITVDGSLIRLLENVGAINIRTGAGDDTIDVQSVAAGTTATINGGGGDDTIRVSSRDGNFDDIAGNVTFTEGAGNSALTLFDQNKVLDAPPEGPPNWVVASNIISRVGAGNISYAGFAGVTIDAGNGHNSFLIDANSDPLTINSGVGDSGFAVLSNPANLTIHNAGGSNAIVLGSDNLSALAGSIKVNPESGAHDHVTLNDQRASESPRVSQRYTINALNAGTTVNRPGFGGLSFNTLDSLTINGGGIDTLTASFAFDFSFTLGLTGFAAASLNVGGNFSGSFLAPTIGTSAAPIQQIQIGQSMTAAAVIKVDYLATLAVAGDLAGTVKGFGDSGNKILPTIGTVTVGGGLTSTGSVTAPILGTVTISGNHSGTISEGSPTQDMQQLTIGGSLTSTSIVSAASIGTMSVGQDLVGQVSVAGPLNTLSVSGNLTGSVSATTIGIVVVGGSLTGQVTASQSIGSVTAGGRPVTQSIFLKDTSLSGTLNVTGNASIKIPGSLFVESNSKTAVTAGGTSQVAAAGIQVVGGVQKSSGATLSPTPITGVASFADPLTFLSGPSTAGLTNYGSASYSSGAHTLQPGIYSQISVSGTATVTLSGGMYIIEGGGVTVTDKASITGAGVTIYNTGSNYPNSGGSYGGITLSGSGSFNVTPAVTAAGGAYPGIVIYQSRSNTRAVALSGNAGGGLTGMVYAPAAPVVISGNASLNAAMVADRLQVSGNGTSTQVTAGSTGDNSASPDTLLAGNLDVYVNDPNGYFTANELARIQDAITGLDTLLAPYNVRISEVNDPSLANVVIDTGSTSAAGSASDGILGCYDGANAEITILQGWSWYDGSNPTQIGSDQYDFQSVMTHELGHALGLGGSTDPTSPMYESLAAGTVHRTPTVADLNIADSPAGADPERATDRQFAPMSMALPQSSVLLGSIPSTGAANYTAEGAAGEVSVGAAPPDASATPLSAPMVVTPQSSAATPTDSEYPVAGIDFRAVVRSRMLAGASAQRGSPGAAPQTSRSAAISLVMEEQSKEHLSLGTDHWKAQVPEQGAHRLPDCPRLPGDRDYAAPAASDQLFAALAVAALIELLWEILNGRERKGRGHSEERRTY